MAFFKFLKNYTIFIGKRLRWSLFLIKLQASRLTNLLKRDSNTTFSCEITLFYLLIRIHSFYHSLSFAVTQCHVFLIAVIRCHFSFIVTCCTTRCHSLTFAVPHDVTRYHLLDVTRYHLLYHTMSLVVSHCQSLSLDISLVFFLIKYHPAEISHEIGIF